MSELTWERYVAWLVDEHGTLAAVAERLAAARGYTEGVETVERALRRLRQRGTQDGGAWGQRALRQFGLPDAVDARLRFMGAYHSRFTDLPVPVCEDLIRWWQRPPTTEARSGAAWLALAWANVYTRQRRFDDVAVVLNGVIVGPDVAPEARIERLLGLAWLASRRAPEAVPGLLADARAALDLVTDVTQRANYFARIVDHHAYEATHGRGPEPGPEAGERWFRTIPDDGPPFALARRANGLAWCAWKQGRVEEGAAYAEQAARHAGDGGHVRLRAMALSMLARIDPRRVDARARAITIAHALDDALLVRRFTRWPEPP
jgi:hypothetical protein